MNLKSQLIIEYDPDNDEDYPRHVVYLKAPKLLMALERVMELVPSGEPKRAALLILENLELRDLI